MKAILHRLAALSPVVIVRRSTVRAIERNAFDIGVDANRYGLVESPR